MNGVFKSECVAGHDLTAPGAVYEYDHPHRGRIRQCKRCTRARARIRSKRVYVPTGRGVAWRKGIGVYARRKKRPGIVTPDSAAAGWPTSGEWPDDETAADVHRGGRVA